MAEKSPPPEPPILKTPEANMPPLIAPVIPSDIPPDLKAFFESVIDRIKDAAATGVASAIDKVLPTSADLNQDGRITKVEELLYATITQFATFAQHTILAQKEQTDKQVQIQQAQSEKMAADAKTTERRSTYMQLMMVILAIVYTLLTYFLRGG